VDVKAPPVIGQVRVLGPWGEAPDAVGGVYRPGDPTVVDFRVFPGVDSQGTPLALNWTLTPYQFDEALASGSEKVPASSGAYREVALRWRPVEGIDAYRLHYSLVNADGDAIDKGELVLGIARDSVVPRTSRQGPLPDRNEIKQTPYLRTTYSPGKATADSLEAAVNRFRSMLRQSREMTNHVTFSVDLADFEPLPGVYDFSLLDAVMDTAFDNQVGITVRIAHAEKPKPYRWQPYTLPRNFDGSVLTGHPYYGSFSLSDARHMRLWRQAFRALHDRYAGHPAFEGYYLMKPSGEWILPDEPWNGAVADYSWVAREAFHDYLRDQLKLDLNGLNTRWGTDYASWADVPIPQPSWQAGTVPDLRPAWLDFMRCKLAWNDTWSVNLAREIRGYDPDRVIIVYIRLMEEPLAPMAGVVDYVHNGGNHFFEAEGQMADAWSKYKIGWITEPHFPHHWAHNFRGWVLDRSVFIALAQAGAGGANLHVYYWSDPTMNLVAHYGGAYAYDRFETFKPILRELHAMELVQPVTPVAVIYDESTLLAKHRTSFRARLMDMRRWFELLRADSVPYEIYRPEREAQYRMVVLNPLDEVMTGEHIAAVTRMARNGAWVVMTANTGKYEAENPGLDFALLRSLGIDPPDGTFDTGATGVAATTEGGGLLADWGASVPFFTQAQMAKELQDRETVFLDWPYRWLPVNGTFGYYRGKPADGGQALARFPDGGVAASLHAVGEGRVLVFWGTPSMDTGLMRGLMARVASEAGITYATEGNPIEHMVEGANIELNRHYALCYMDEPGTYVQKLPHVPDGEWFVDDMVSGERLGLVQGEDLRQRGIALTYRPEASPLKILRLIPGSEVRPFWADSY
jgi:hypothetical protein